MESYISSSVSLLSNIWYLPAIALGVATGIFLGALPGISAPMALSIALPLTYSIDPNIGIGFLLGLFNGVVFGGSIPAVLVNIPGTPGAVVTTLDGYPMTQRGESGKALGTVVVASFAGGVFSIIVLILSAPLLAKLAMKFSPHDYFAIGVLGLSITSSISGKSVLLGFWSAMFGIMVSTVGMDFVTSERRFVYGIPELLGGIPFPPIMVGLFGFSYVLTSILESRAENAHVPQKVANLLLTWCEFKGLIKSIAQGSVIGTIIGALPGPGGAIASFVSYYVIKKTSRKERATDRHDFGEGRLEGVAAPEAANNAVTGGVLIPALTLGIPGDASAAIIIGALMMHNVSPGPLFFQNNIETVYGIYNSLIAANIFMVLIGLILLKVFVKFLSTPKDILTPIILVACVTGSYTTQNNVFGIVVMLIFGVVGFVFHHVNIPVMPFILGIVLGPIIENNYRQAMIIEGGNVLGLAARPSSGIVLAVAVLLLVVPGVQKMVLMRASPHADKEERKKWED